MTISVPKTGSAYYIESSSLKAFLLAYRGSDSARLVSYEEPAERVVNQI